MGEIFLSFTFGPLIMLYVGYYLKLIKRYYTKKFKEIKQIPKVEKIKSVEIKDEKVKEFVKKSINIKYFNQSFFYNNLKTLKIKRSKNLKMLNIYVNQYTPVDNAIYITDENALFHELNHVSSSYYDGDDYSGLSQNEFGTGLNEGYTELLMERYYQFTDSYCVEKRIAINLEKIIGREKSEECYYTANLYDFIEELKQYDTEENILKFINYVDIMSSLIDNSILNKVYYHILVNSMKKINLYLLKWYTLKQKRLLENKLISNKQCYNNIQKYSKKLVSLKNVESVKYRVLDKKLINKEVEKILGERVLYEK